MASIRTDYVEKRRQISRDIINLMINIVSLDYTIIEKIPLSDFNDIKIVVENMLYSVTKPRQVDESEISL